ncbi:MAG: hypothetical protein M3O15_01825 [Acidobacteriota bacterium]|nr:hypothetical protein [Acidobacteriota bacterium]
MLSSAFFSASLACLLAVWAAAARASRRGQPVPALTILLAGSIPPLLVASVMITAGTRFGDLRVTLEGMRLRLGPADRGVTVRVGGSPDEDHLVVRGLPPGFLFFRAVAGGVRVELGPAAPKPERSKGDFERPFAAVRLNGVRPFHNAVPLTSGARVLFASGTALRFDTARRSFVPDAGTARGSYLSIARRTSSFVLDRLQVPIRRELTAEAETYPLRYYAAPDGVPPQTPAGERSGSFICQDGGLMRGDFYLVLTGPEARVERPGLPPSAFEPAVTTIPDGGSARLALFRLDYHDPRDPDASRPSRAQERRSLLAKYTRGVLELILDTPDTVRLGRAELDALRQEAARTRVPMLLTLAGEAAEPDISKGRMLLRFEAIGAPLRNELWSRIEPPAQGKELRVTTHAGSRLFEIGDAFPIGEDMAVLLRVSRLDLPWGALALVAVMSAASVFAGRERRSRALDLMLLSGVELLLAVRFLIAYQGAGLDASAAAAVWESLGVLVLLPFLVQASLELHARSGKLAAPTLCHGLLATAALATILSRLPAAPSTWLSLLLPAVVPLLLGGLLLPALDRLPLGLPSAGGRASSLWLVGGAAGLILLRLLTLLLLGWKERMTLGLSAAVSLYYIPWALLIFALLWARRERPLSFVWLWLLLGILYLAIPALAHDWGTAFIFSLPALLLFALPLVERPTWLSRLLAVPLAFTLAVHTVLPLVPAFNLSHRVAGWEPGDIEVSRADPAAAAALLERKTATTQNALRVWNLAAPRQLREVGTTAAESQVIVMENLRDYASRGLLGTGYLGVPLSPPLTATQLDDNLSAVHLLGTFGWLGSLLLLLLLAAWAVAPLLSTARGGAIPAAGITPRAAFGLMLLWTFFAAGMYMLSANTELLLFTGKNVYFLAAASLSDAAEGGLLITLALWALGEPAGARQAGP